MDIICYLSLSSPCLFLAALWSPVGKGLTSRLSSCVFCHFTMQCPRSGLDLIVPISDLYILSYFVRYFPGCVSINLCLKLGVFFKLQNFLQNAGQNSTNT